MNIQAFLDLLKARPGVVILDEPRYLETGSDGAPISVGDTYAMYVVTLEKSLEKPVGVRKKIFFYVKNPGEVSEDAFFMESEQAPILTPSQTFTETVLNFIYSTGLAQFAVVDNIDIDRMRAVATVYKPTTGADAEKLLVVLWKPEGQPVQYRIVR